MQGSNWNKPSCLNFRQATCPWKPNCHQRETIHIHKVAILIHQVAIQIHLAFIQIQQAAIQIHHANIQIYQVTIQKYPHQNPLDSWPPLPYKRHNKRKMDGGHYTRLWCRDYNINFECFHREKIHIREEQFIKLWWPQTNFQSRNACEAQLCIVNSTFTRSV